MDYSNIFGPAERLDTGVAVEKDSAGKKIQEERRRLEELKVRCLI